MKSPKFDELMAAEAAEEKRRAAEKEKEKGGEVDT